MTSWCTNNTEPVKDGTNATSSYLLTFAKLLSVIEMQNIKYVVRTTVLKLRKIAALRIIWVCCAVVTTIFRLHATSYLKFQCCSCRQVNSNNDKTLNKERCGRWVFWEFLVKVIYISWQMSKTWFDWSRAFVLKGVPPTNKLVVMQLVIMSATQTMLYWFSNVGFRQENKIFLR